MSSLHIHLLGSFQVVQNDRLADGRSLTGFRTDKIRALLAYLAVEADRPHRRDTLAALFWPDMDDQKARYNLRLSLHRLRQTLGDGATALHIDRQSVQFDATQAWVDVGQFEQALTAVTTHTHPHPTTCSPCMAHLETAVAQYHGDFLPGFFLADDLPFAEWVTTRRERLHQEALQALDWLAAYHLGCGQTASAIPHARRQLELEPWRESAHRQMMQALAATGQHAAALAHYETCCRILRDELGAEPSPETVILYTEIKETQTNTQPVHEEIVGTRRGLNTRRGLSLSKSGLRQAQPSSQALPPSTAATTPFIGRQEELATLHRLLSNPAVRLVTIVGAGGMGKTRLAQACLASQANLDSQDDLFTHGVCFVPLTAVTTPAQIMPAITKALAFAPEPDDPDRTADQQVFDYLRPRQILILLDNFEQLLDGQHGEASTAVLHQLLEHAPQATLLITSRERLHLRAEHVLPLDGLPCPASHEREIDDYAVVQLFQQSARRLQPNFALTPDDLPPLIAICHLLEGMPLGLELAAAWVDLLPLAEIAAEIQNSLDFLTADLRDWPDRHRSLRAVFDASWARLSQPEQDLFAQLSLFRGGFNRAAVQAVIGGEETRPAVLRLLSSLVSKSLLHYDRQSDRYILHELLRQYGAEKLTDEAARARYGRYYATWLADQTAALKGGRQKAALSTIEADIDNIRVAWAWAVDRQEWTLLFAAAFSLGTFFYRQGRHQEGLTLFSNAAAKADTDSAANPQIRARLLYWQAMFEPAATTRQSWLNTALALLETAVSDPHSRTGQAAILLELGSVAYGQGQHETAERYFEQSLLRCRLADDRWGEANVLCELGVSAWSKGAYGEAEQRFSQSLIIRQALQDHVGTAVALEGLAGTAMFAGDGEQAIAYTQQSLAVYQQVGDRVGTAVLQAELGNKNWYQHLTGIELIEDSLLTFADLGTRRHLAHWTVILAMYKADIDSAAGERLAHEGLRLCQEIGYQRGVGIAYGILSRAAWLAEDYGRSQALAQTYLCLTEEMSLPLERSDARTWLAWAYLAVGQQAEAENQVRLILNTPNLWQVAALNIAAILLAQRSPVHSAWAWQLLGYGEGRFGRHRGAVSQQMIHRFMPAAMKATPPAEVARLKQEGQQLEGQTIFVDLLAALA